jgi:hypothetical protein
MTMTRTTCLACLLVLGLVPSAFAADTALPSAYVPLTVDEAHYQALRNYLEQQPFRIALPIVQWLEQLELDAKIEADRKAKAEAAKAEADKAPAAPK